MTIPSAVLRRLRSARRPEVPSAAAPWDELQAAHRYALTQAWTNHVPPAASAIQARWWQLESWLRSLVYVELRTQYGSRWVEQLPPGGRARASTAQTRRTYMSTPDARNHMAYLDVSHLFEIIGGQWDLFKPSLIDDQTGWSGRVGELTEIRNRVAHCRRPHHDDLSRLEQVLRDLEPGARQALTAYHDTWTALPSDQLDDPVLEGWWYKGRHNADLIKHAQASYNTNFTLGASRRPWAMPLSDDQPVAGAAGYLWHATWTGGNGELHLRDWWDDIAGCQDLIVYAGTRGAGHLSVSFAAIDDPEAVADAIGVCFRAAIHNQGVRWPALEDDWSEAYEDLDFCLQLGTPWAVADGRPRPISIFGAERPS